ncbi:hypothetical protein K3N28_00170 [Glycomyces sp. TRM65418]|uniref:hypothetical protein n=1 Tax=Glycomyces sp. TRM65418 TaxID=2867006 RepID=UPI001CE70C6F|nr:hypothetical protein [Glycomyces sp. TRM65418]MCC3761495.1 hypothetical protein [Glycomyces sp. TRM65418]QZD55593.1 hypothetical protein K3N28_00170 [Glycomyces sp. TRM65418]
MLDPFTDAPIPPQGDRPPENGIGTTALVFGLIAFALLWVPMLYLYTWPVCLLAVIFGAVGLHRARTGLATNRSTAAGGFFSGLGSLIVMALATIIILSDGPLPLP